MKIRYLLVLLICSLALRFYFIFRVPVSWNPSSTTIQAFNDEPAHVNYVQYLRENRSLPLQKQHAQEKNAFITNQFEYYQPPLAYVLTAILAGLGHIPTQSQTLFIFCRIVICVAGLLGIVLFYSIASKFFSAKWSLLFTSLYAFMPVHWRHTSSFSNDAFLWIFMILLLFMISKKLHNPYQMKDRFIEGCLIGLGLWTKLSMLTIIPAYIILSMLDRKQWQNWILPALIGCLISSPYFIRNYLLYQELFGIQLSHGPAQEALQTLSPYILFRFIRGFLLTFTFPFDTLDIPFYLKLPAYLLWAFLFIMFMIQFLIRNIRSIQNRSLSLHTILSIIVFSTAASVIYYNWKYLQTEFRNIFYIMPVLLLQAGSYIWKGNYFKWMVLLLTAVCYPLILVLWSTW